MKKKTFALLTLCICCFLTTIQAQSSLDCTSLQKKVEKALTIIKTMRVDYWSSTRKIYVDFEKDAQANEHFWVRRTTSEYSTQAVIKIGGKTYFAQTMAGVPIKETEWKTAIPTSFDAKSWLDSCNSAIKLLNQPFSSCVLTKDVKITGTPFAIYSVVIEKDTFKLWINKTTDKIETIQGVNRKKDINYSWEFDTPFTISAPPSDLKDNYNFGFSAFPPMYSREEYFDGNEMVYAAVDKLPEFHGGQAALFKFLGQNIIYPKNARKNGIEGTIYTGFVVEKDGSVTNLKLKRGVSPELNEEAMRVIKLLSGKWEPGWYAGQKVRVAYTLPTKFKLE